MIFLIIKMMFIVTLFYCGIAFLITPLLRYITKPKYLRKNYKRTK